MTMRNDATRLRIDAKEKRRARAVVSRQGQVLLDTDFDQQAVALLGRIETEAADVFDSAGRLVYPAGTTGFQVVASGNASNFDIGAGHGYLDGWLIENPATAKLATQPHPRNPADTVTPPAIIGLKALVRFIDPVEDPALADVALGDAKASGRSLVDWQVFALSGQPAGIDCAGAPSAPDWVALTAPSAGKMSVIKQAAGASTDPCSLTPGGGYTRLENLLYRIEVHSGANKAGFPTVDGPRFALNQLKVKFSRTNASLMARVTLVSGSEITVEPASLDARAWFAPGAYAEIVNVHDDVDPRAALASQRLFRVASATDDKIVLDTTPANVTATGIATDGKWFLRLWDAFPNGDGLATIAAGADSQVIDLGDGLSIQFHNGAAATFRHGDFWTFAARADGSVAWPETVPGTPDRMVPHGPETRYTVLAAVSGTAAAPVFENCSIPSFSLTDRFLFYRGGDGQSVFAGKAAPAFVPLPQKLRVAVMRGETPVKGATIRWSPPIGAPDSRINGQPCTAALSQPSTTDANGLVEVDWAIDRAQPLAAHKVQATLQLAAGKDLPDPIVFNATFETGAHTAYVPGACEHLKDVDNVQEALDTLCEKIDEKRPVLTLKQIRLLSSKGAAIELIRQDTKEMKDVILNGLTDVPPDAITGGIRFGFDGEVANIEIMPFDPVVEVELDLPYPTTDMDRVYWSEAARVPGGPPTLTGPFGFQRLRLDGTVTRAAAATNLAPGLLWQPSQQAAMFLAGADFHRFGQTPVALDQLKRAGWIGEPGYSRILCRIRLRAPMIWTGKDRERAYLNAEHLGMNGSITKRELELGARDPQTAADLDMFIYLKVPPRPATPAPAGPGGTILVDVPPILGNLGNLGDIGTIGTIATERIPRPVRGFAAAAGTGKPAARRKPKGKGKGKPKPAK
jgi:hypothetical protein